MAGNIFSYYYFVNDHALYLWDGGVDFGDLDWPYQNDTGPITPSATQINLTNHGRVVTKLYLVATDEEFDVGPAVEGAEEFTVRITDGLLGIGVPGDGFRAPDGTFMASETVILRLNTASGVLPVRVREKQGFRNIYVVVPDGTSVLEISSKPDIPHFEKRLADDAVPTDAIPIDEFADYARRGYVILNNVVEHSDGKRFLVDPMRTNWFTKLAFYGDQDPWSDDFPWRVTHYVARPATNSS